MTFVLIPGAGCTPWHWRPLTAELTRRGHDVVPVDIPWQDPEAGLKEYADAVVDQVGDRIDVTLVAHSQAGHIAPLVCDRLPVRLIVFLAAMIPRPGEPVKDWWKNTGFAGPGAGEVFFHDLPPEVAAEGHRQRVEMVGAGVSEPWPLERFPEVPMRVLIGAEDRLFPPDFLRRMTMERLGLVAEEMPGAHFPMLGHPDELADRLEIYLRAEPTGP